MHQNQLKLADIHRAMEENFWSLWSRFGQGEGCRLQSDAETIWFETPIPQLPYNGVLKFTVHDNVDERINVIFNAYQERKVPFFWVVHPTSSPADITKRLQQRGFNEVEVFDGMWMDLQGLPGEDALPRGIAVNEVVPGEDMESFMDLVFWRWNIAPEYRDQLAGMAKAIAPGHPHSPVRCWIASKDGVPVSKVLLNCNADAAGIFAVVTKPEAQGLGLARALTLRALTAARVSGYRLGILHATDMARSMYARIGFQSLVPFRLFTLPNSFHA